MVGKFMKSPTSTGYVLNSTSSSATNRRFFMGIGGERELSYASILLLHQA